MAKTKLQVGRWPRRVATGVLPGGECHAGSMVGRQRRTRGVHVASSPTDICAKAQVIAWALKVAGRRGTRGCRDR